MFEGGDSLAPVVGDKSECDAYDTQLMISQSGTFTAINLRDRSAGQVIECLRRKAFPRDEKTGIPLECKENVKYHYIEMIN